MSEVKSKEVEIRKAFKTDYPLIPMNDISTEARLLAVAWGENMQDDFILQKQKLASDIMNYARRWHDQQSRLLREALEKIRDTKEFEFMSTAVVLSMKAIAKEALEK